MSAIVFTVPHKVLTIIQHTHIRIYIPTKCAKFGPYGLTAINPNPDGSLYAFLYCPQDYGILVFLREFINKINKFENHIQCSQCPTILLCLTPSLQYPTKFLQKSNTHMCVYTSTKCGSYGLMAIGLFATNIFVLWTVLNVSLHNPTFRNWI